MTFFSIRIPQPSLLVAIALNFLPLNGALAGVIFSDDIKEAVRVLPMGPDQILHTRELYMQFKVNPEIEADPHSRKMMSEALFPIAVAYAEGVKVDQDIDLGLRFLTEASQLGNFYAQSALADAFYFGRYVNKSMEMARNWYLASLSSEEGREYAGETYSKVAITYISEPSPKQENYQQAIKFLHQAIKHGDVDSRQILAAILYSHGKGQDKKVEAYKWLLLSDALNNNEHSQHANAVNLERIILSKLTAEELKEARARAQNWNGPFPNR